MKKTILFFYTNLSSFVKKDIEILEKQFRVKQFHFNVSSKILLPLVFVKQKLFLLGNIFSEQLVICQFGGYHSFLPVLFAKLIGKKSLLIIGGVDSVSYPSFNYGYLHKFPLGMITKWSYRMASHIAPKHESLVLSDDTYYGVDFPKQGIKYFIPELKTPITVINNGYDPEKWKRIVTDAVKGKRMKPHNTFITVAGGFNYPFQVMEKGIDLVFEMAKTFSECDFILVGVDPGQQVEMIAKYNLPASNMKFFPPQPNNKLVDYFSKADFYFQLSISEGFPNALCEAMLCGCIPIVSDVGAMPEIIGDSGFILKKRNADMLKKIIEEARECDKGTLSEKARNRIKENFTVKKREEALVALAGHLSE